MKIGLLTSNEPRHEYFIYKLLESFKISIVVTEPKKKKFSKFRKIILKGQKKEEKFFFKKFILKKRQKTHIINTNNINSNRIFNKLREKKLDLLIVFGTSLLKEKIFLLPKYSTINLHTGILPNYRGVDSVIWAFKNNDLNNIGYTIHHIDKGIDSGPNIIKEKIIPKEGENVHLVFLRVVFKGVQGIINTIKKKNLKLKENLTQN